MRVDSAPRPPDSWRTPAISKARHVQNQNAWQLLSASQVFSPVFLVGLLFAVRSVIDRIGNLARYELLSLLHDYVGGLAQIARLLIQVVQAFTAALAEEFARLFMGEHGGH